MITTLAADHDIAGLDIRSKTFINIYHTMGSQFLWIKTIQIAGGNDDVSVDVAPVAVRGSFELHDRSSS